MNQADFAAQKTVRLTTRGRRSGEPRTVKIWFVADGPRRILVQHVTSAPANWYRNLLKNSDVIVDFGDGPIGARATAISDAQRVQQVLAGVRRKYWSAWLIQLLGRKIPAVAAEIEW